MKALIKLNNITKKYDDNEVLKGISLEIQKGEYCAICGSSGAGKSTLMNIIGLIENYTSGSYFFDGNFIDNKKDYASIRADNIGFIFQAYNLIPTLNSRENILLLWKYSSKNRKQINNNFDKIISTMRIESLMDKRVNVLSGGEKQRIAIARALLLNPQMIIADEPTGNLDQKNKDIVLDTLEREKKAGKTILVVTHDLEVAKTADRIIQIREGIIYDKTYS